MRSIINKTKFINVILCFCLLTGFAYASSENITIKFENNIITAGAADDNNYMLLAALNSYDMPCKGENGAYNVSKVNFNKGSDLTDDKKIVLSIEGPYSGDKRKICKTKSDDVYFTLSNLVIDFDYKGRDYKCHINQNIGTSYIKGAISSDKLRGDLEDQDINCSSDNLSPFSYKLNPGSTLSSGYISIHRNSDFSPSKTARVNIFSFNPDIKNYSFDTNTTNMNCAGESNAYSINKYLNIDAALEVKGTFSNDNRLTCTLPTDQMYYILEKATIHFEYKGEPKSCSINAKFGTSRDKLHSAYNKLQSYIPDNPFGKSTKETPNECVGASGFFYRIIQGNDLLNTKYNPGYIEIYQGNYTRVSKFPISWNLYVNGMNNTIDDAMASSLVISNMGANSTDDSIQYGLLYNKTNGSAADFTDLENMKTFDNILARGDYIPAYEQIYGSCPTDTSGYQQCQQDALNWYLTMAYSESGAAQLGLKPGAIFGTSFDLLWASFLNYGIESSDKILLIAHSQGNLYANTLVNYLVANRNFPRDNLNAIQVGVTSTMLSSRTDDLFKQVFPENMPMYITNIYDSVINSWRNSVRTLGGVLPLPGNLGYKNESFLNTTDFDNQNHGFVNAYLNHKSTKDAFTNILASYTAYNEMMLNSYRPASYTGVYVYEISKNIESMNGYGGYLFDGSYSESSAKPNFKVYKDSINTSLDLDNDARVLLKDQSNNIQSFELKSYGHYIFDASNPGIRYVINNTNSSQNLYCNDEPYMMILSSTIQKVICRNSNRQIILPLQAANAIGVDLK